MPAPEQTVRSVGALARWPSREQTLASRAAPPSGAVRYARRASLLARMARSWHAWDASPLPSAVAASTAEFATRSILAALGRLTRAHAPARSVQAPAADAGCSQRVCSRSHSAGPSAVDHSSTVSAAAVVRAGGVCHLHQNRRQAPPAGALVRACQRQVASEPGFAAPSL